MINLRFVQKNGAVFFYLKMYLLFMGYPPTIIRIKIATITKKY